MTGKFYEIDLLIEGEIILEAKAVDIMHPVYDAQIISYMKLIDKRLGYLVNFNVVRLKDGFRRFVNNFWFYVDNNPRGRETLRELSASASPRLKQKK
ncbi:MAG TPA: GxxExxY protein [Chitinophagaceae bacterium]|nr:GxxExxY protein [Chitinophagaceae bacterium]